MPWPTTGGSTRRGATTRYGSKPKPSCVRSALSKVRSRSTLAGTGRLTAALRIAGADIIGVDLEPAIRSTSRIIASPRSWWATRSRFRCVTARLTSRSLSPFSKFVVDPAAAIAELCAPRFPVAVSHCRRTQPTQRLGSCTPPRFHLAALERSPLPYPRAASRSRRALRPRRAAQRVIRARCRSIPRRHRASPRAARSRTTELGRLPNSRRRDKL